VFEGRIPGTTEVVPQARILLDWADALGIEVGGDEAAGPARSAPAVPSAHAVTGAPTLDACIRVLSTKGFGTAPTLGDAVLASANQVQPLLDQLVVDGLAASVAGAYRLTEAGKGRSAELMSADRAAWGIEAAGRALDAFLALDQRMKDIVTAWQLRSTDGEPVVNDHGDADYDREVLERLSALHADAAAWLTPLDRASRRLATYRPRLARAAERALGGDAMYVASPRVDSFHGIWFELHEDLIQLAGRTREDEVSAGRA
jgi:pyruvate,orthophosphate dikinase